MERVKPDFKFKEWVKSVATPEYKKHFHRNYASGDKEAMRSMWSATIDRQEQVPICLKSVKCVGPDELQYPFEEPTNEVFSSEFHVAVTLRGLLRREFDRDIADQLFNELIQKEEFFLWENRGPEIFEIVTKRSIAELFPSAMSQNFSDLVALLEYDIYDGTCRYDRDNIATFGAAIDQHGYRSLFFFAVLIITTLNYRVLDFVWLGNAMCSSFYCARVICHIRMILYPLEILGLSKI